MLKEEGRVIALDGSFALVAGLRRKACGSCAAAPACSALSGGMGSREVRIRAENCCDAEVGDRVILELSEQAFLHASFWAYAMPLMVLLLVGGSTRPLFDSMGLEADMIELASALSGLFAMAVSFLFMRSISKSAAFGTIATPKMVAIIAEPFACPTASCCGD